jgi:hypothetical protein
MEFVGKTTRAYLFAPATDDHAITVPKGVHAVMIRLNASALKVSIGATAIVVDSNGSSRVTNSMLLGVDDGTQSRFLSFVRPGEIISISHTDGSTAIGSFELWCFADAYGATLPADAAAFTQVDPGA